MHIVNVFGIFLALGFLFATFQVWRQARTYGLSEEKVLDIYFLTTFLVVLVGRITYVYSHWVTFSTDYSRIIFFIKYPGLSYPTMLLTAILVSTLLVRSAGMEILLLADIFSFAILGFTFLGDVGCYFNGCFQSSALTPLYLSFLALLFLGFFVFLAKKFKSNSEFAVISKKRGIFFLCYLIFQLISLLMTTWVTKNWGREVLYGLGLGTVLVIAGIRYQELFKHLYYAVSKKRPGSN